MKLIWDGRVREPFIVRDVLALTPELAYTTVMTTLNRLADKGLLSVTKVGSHQPHKNRASGGVKEFLTDSGRAEVDRLVERYGDAALAAFAARLDRLSPATREALKRLRSR
jgi:predicted transcriptional regulator